MNAVLELKTAGLVGVRCIVTFHVSAHPYKCKYTLCQCDLQLLRLACSIALIPPVHVQILFCSVFEFTLQDLKIIVIALL